MGEQTLISQSPTQPQQLHNNETTTITTTTTTITKSSPPSSPTPLTQTTPPPSSPTSIAAKLPFRSRKTRKLSTKTTPNSETLVVSTPRIIVRNLSCEGEVGVAIRHLRASDPHLARVIDANLPPKFDCFQPPFLALAKSILYQQLAYKAGTTIYNRFVALCGGEANVIPEVVHELTPVQLRQIGVSGRKAGYLHDLASKYMNGILSDSALVTMDEKSLFTLLTMVKGIGPWSVHMFLIFSLHRPDILPVGDLGVRKGVQVLYGLEELPRPSQMESLCEKWKPYRSVASWYMWRLAEPRGTRSSVTVDPSQLPNRLIDTVSDINGLGTCTWGQ